MTDDKPKPECICGEINARNCPIHQQKPDQPREWWIFERSHFEQIAYNESGPGRFHVIEKSAYDALQKRCEELEQNEFKMNGALSAKQEIIDGQKEDLAAAEAEIERLKSTLCDIENESTDRMFKLTQANARIKELIAALERAKNHCTHPGDGHYELGKDMREAIKKSRGG